MREEILQNELPSFPALAHLAENGFLAPYSAQRLKAVETHSMSHICRWGGLCQLTERWGSSACTNALELNDMLAEFNLQRSSVESTEIQPCGRTILELAPLCSDFAPLLNPQRGIQWMHLRNSFISTTRCDDLARATEAQDGKKKPCGRTIRCGTKGIWTPIQATLCSNYGMPQNITSAERRPGPERSLKKQYSKWSGDCNTSLFFAPTP